MLSTALSGDAWLVRQSGCDPATAAFYETLFTVGNGRLGAEDLSANLVGAIEKVKFVQGETGPESMIDLLFGATYRVANNWTAGLEARYHNDFYGYKFQTHTQRAWFFGPNVHYATKDWWVTGAWRWQPTGGKCWAPNEAECSDGRVWDSHTKNEFIVKFGMPF